MAVHRRDYKIGDVVYESYSPNNPGIVLKVKPPPNVDYVPSLVRGNTLVVKFYSGKIKEVDALYLADFRALIEDHKKKVRTHEAKLAMLEMGREIV